MSMSESRRLSCLLLLAGAASGAAVDAHAQGAAKAQDATAAGVTHVDLDLAVRFEARVLEGRARLRFPPQDVAGTLRVDTHRLAIVGISGAGGKVRPHRVGRPDRDGGQELSIDLAPGDREVTVRYRTAPDAEALHWLPKPHAPGGRRPWVNSYGGRRHTRSWIPLQDRPDARVTFTARVTVPAGHQVVMSADQRAVRDGGVFEFTMARAVAPASIALVCGDLGFAEVTGRCGVYAPPPQVKEIARQLRLLKKLDAAFVARFGPLPWARADIVVMPVGYPFRGVGYPNLVCLSPADLPVNGLELLPLLRAKAQAWTARVLGVHSWADDWFGRGLAVYVARRLAEQVLDPDRAAIERAAAARYLQAEVALLAEPRQVLAAWQADWGADPLRDRFVANKAAEFLHHLEAVFGRDAFDGWLRGLPAAFAGRPPTTARLLAHLDKTLVRDDAAVAARAAIRTWVNRPGLPQLAVGAGKLGAEVDQVVARVLAAPQVPGGLQVGHWSADQWLYFLATIPPEALAERLISLDQRVGLASHPRAAVRGRFLELAFRHQRLEFLTSASEFPGSCGALACLAPLVRAMAVGPEGKDRAREMLLSHEAVLPPMTLRVLERIIE